LVVLHPEFVGDDLRQHQMNQELPWIESEMQKIKLEKQKQKEEAEMSGQKEEIKEMSPKEILVNRDIERLAVIEAEI
jgi:hypothetical protein